MMKYSSCVFRKPIMSVYIKYSIYIIIWGVYSFLSISRLMPTGSSTPIPRNPEERFLPFIVYSNFETKKQNNLLHLSFAFCLFCSSKKQVCLLFARKKTNLFCFAEQTFLLAEPWFIQKLLRHIFQIKVIWLT